ncbi:response regulator [Methylophaga sp.]|uniref:GGDEF domain-containing response regulator n=1 Tax=Methylophaga sp. TaxID=2024840 RepID=UPI0013FE5CCD|nr:response regulator [Methylophaga sp.]MTI63896.1 response regulator [Methylophaga sp.]
MKVLIVDDAEIDSLLCQKIVESLDYRPIAVSSAVEALEILHKPGAPDIIIMDWFMPEITGIELCERVRRMHLMVEPFILIMTANTDRHAEAEALNAGADDFISKPINRIDMEAKLRLGRRLIKTQLALLVANQKLQEKLQYDAVTGIMNRQSGLRAISAALSRLSRQSHNQGLLVHCHVRLNTDKQSRFKHDVHDKIYIELAGQLARILRQSDIVVRFRDDEFLFFAESDPDSHQNLMQRIERAIVRDYATEAEADSSFLIAGLVIRPEQAMTPVESLLQQTEIILTNLHSVGKNTDLITLSSSRNTRVVDFADYRRAQAKN